MELFRGPGFWVILLLVLLLFGAPKLPGLAKSLGQSMKIFKKEIDNSDKDGASDSETPETSDPTSKK